MANVALITEVSYATLIAQYIRGPAVLNMDGVATRPNFVAKAVSQVALTPLRLEVRILLTANAATRKGFPV